MITLSITLVAIGLDWLIGEPRRYHPLVGFGKVADYCEKLSNESVFERFSPLTSGLIFWVLLVVPPTLGLWLLLYWLPTPWQWCVECLILYFTIGWKSMQQHALEVYKNLLANDLDQARQSVKLIVSRQTETLDERGVATGAVEAVIENGSDCVLSPIFWFVLLGAPGALMFRLANTLDAMWGNKTDRYILFGRTAAKIDDFLNWIPARLTAFGYAVCGSFRKSIACMKLQKAESEGPNAGLVMAAGGGALGIKLGGPVIYHGQLDARPVLGTGRSVETIDIVRSINLVWRTICMWLLITALVVSSIYFVTGYS